MPGSEGASVFFYASQPKRHWQGLLSERNRSVRISTRSSSRPRQSAHPNDQRPLVTRKAPQSGGVTVLAWRAQPEPPAGHGVGH